MVIDWLGVGRRVVLAQRRAFEYEQYSGGEGEEDGE